MTVVISNSIGTRTCEIVYDLNELDITRKWTEKFKAHFADRIQIANHGFFFGRRFYEAEYLVAEMKSGIAYLRPHFPRVFENCPEPSLDMSQFQLSDIHERFESIEQQPNWIPVISLHDDIQARAQWLNLLIHMFEALSGPPDCFHIDLNLQPTLKWEMVEEDFDEMTYDKADGDLLISYGTTGVHPAMAFLFGPPASPTFQTTYSCDLQLHFEGPTRFGDISVFDEWLKREHKVNRVNGRPHPGYLKIGHLANGQTKEDILDKLSAINGAPVVSGLRLARAPLQEHKESISSR